MFDTGNTGFMLVATSLVMLMTPGLAFFYGGLVGRKNVLAIMIQSFVSMGWTSVLWFICGYSLCFSAAGRRRGHRQPRPCVHAGRVAHATCCRPQPTSRCSCSCAYQMMFAIITPALITGAFTNRVRFVPYLIFLTVWLLFVYFPFVHMVWGGGLLQRWGVLDFAGGIVVHAIAGMAALASVFFVGKRKVAEKGPAQHPAGRARHRPAVVRLVRLQRRQRAAGRRRHGAGLPEHRHRRLLRGHHLADHGVDLREEAQVPRPAHRLHRRPRHHHPGGRLRDPARPRC